jgi:PAS domain S-box-containing protein
MARVLLIDHKLRTQKFIIQNLNSTGNTVYRLPHGEDAFACLDNDRAFDLVIARAADPVTFKDFLKQIQRQYPTLPVVAVSASESIDAAIDILAAGAVDYLTDSQLIECRIVQAIQRALDWRNRRLQEQRIVEQITIQVQRLRAGWMAFDLTAEELPGVKSVQTAEAARPAPAVPTFLQVGGLIVQIQQRTVIYQGQVLDLSPTEFQIMQVLAEAQGGTVSHEAMAYAVHRQQMEQTAARRSLSTHISNLRTKMREAGCENYLINKWGIGYALNVNAESALRQSEEKYQIVFDNAPVGIVLLNPGGEILEANQTFCKMIGYTLEEIRQHRLDQNLYSPDEFRFAQRLLNGEIDRFQMENQYPTKWGDVIRMRIQVSLKRDEQGEPLYFVATCEDITRTQQTEAALYRIEQLYRTLVQHLPNTVVLLFDENLLYIAAEGTNLPEPTFQPERVRGRRVQDVYDPDKAAHLIPYYEQTLRGESIAFELKIESVSYFLQMVPFQPAPDSPRLGMLVVQARYAHQGQPAASASSPGR